MRDRSLWTWHIGAGLVILVFLGLHMVIMHLNGSFPTFNNHFGGEAESWQNVAWRMRGLFFPVTYVVLLGAALYHGLYGLRTILFELTLRPAMEKAVSAVLLILGLGLFGVGAWAAIAAHGAALATGW